MDGNIPTRSGIKYAAEYPSRLNKEEVNLWCSEQFGEPSLLNGRWFPLEFTIQFSNKKDRNWFLLRWSK